MDKGICELCGAAADLERHHLIPRSVIKRVQPEAYHNKTILVCAECHRAIHESFLEHLSFSGRIRGLEGCDVYGAIKYQLIKDYLKREHPGVYPAWRKHLSRMVDSVFKEMDHESNTRYGDLSMLDEATRNRVLEGPFKKEDTRAMIKELVREFFDSYPAAGQK